MVKRRNKKTEIKRLNEENKTLREWNIVWQEDYRTLQHSFMELIDKYSTLMQQRENG